MRAKCHNYRISSRWRDDVRKGRFQFQEELVAHHPAGMVTSGEPDPYQSAANGKIHQLSAIGDVQSPSLSIRQTQFDRRL